jgi:hypothetical protein
MNSPLAGTDPTGYMQSICDHPSAAGGSSSCVSGMTTTQISNAVKEALASGGLSYTRRNGGGRVRVVLAGNGATQRISGTGPEGRNADRAGANEKGRMSDQGGGCGLSICNAVAATAFGARARRSPDDLTDAELQTHVDRSPQYVGADAVEFDTLRFTAEWASGRIDDATYEQLMCGACGDPYAQKVGIYGTTAAATFGLAIEAGPALAAGNRFLFGKGAWLNRGANLRIGVGREGGTSVFRVAGKWLERVPAPIRSRLGIKEIKPGEFKWDLWVRGDL